MTRNDIYVLAIWSAAIGTVVYCPRTHNQEVN